MSLIEIPRFRFPFGKRLPAFAAVCFLGLLFAGSRAAQSQALPTASRSTNISGFATFGRLETDYGKKDTGISLGADVGFFPHFFHLLDPAVEARLTLGTGSNITQTSFGGGLKLGKNLGKFHPYGVFGIGYGIINFANAKPSYTSDNSVIYSLGGGFDYTVHGPFSIKVDYQYQLWRLSKYLNYLTPNLYSVGVTYTIPSKTFRSER